MSPIFPVKGRRRNIMIRNALLSALASHAVIFLLASPATAAPIIIDIFNNTNIGLVTDSPSGPPNDTVFTLTEDHFLTFITTYHWNSGAGVPAGTIGLRRQSDGVLVASWSAVPSATDPPGVYLEVNSLNDSLAAGTYKVEVSDPATWSFNATSGNQGFAQIQGFVPEPGTSLLVSLGLVGLAVMGRRERRQNLGSRCRSCDGSEGIQKQRRAVFDVLWQPVE
jgi:hypothetical protein